MATAFAVEWPAGLEAIGAAEECEPTVKFDRQYNMEVPYFEEEVYFVQRFRAAGICGGDALRLHHLHGMRRRALCLPP